jgi:hypothetical protein
MVITATGVTPEMVRVDFLMVDGCFFISMISVTKSAWTNKPGEWTADRNYHSPSIPLPFVPPGPSGLRGRELTQQFA